MARRSGDRPKGVGGAPSAVQPALQAPDAVVGDLRTFFGADKTRAATKHTAEH